VAVLQILGNLPISVNNVAALMPPALDAGSMADKVKEAVERLLKGPRLSRSARRTASFGSSPKS